jgi:[ribosomal protein S5]-alanine N-acetyltransferase
MIRFQTDRLIIRDILAEDIDFLLEIYWRKENMKFISGGRYDWTKEQLTEKYIQCNKNQASGYGVFIVCVKDLNTVIGEAGLFDSFGEPNKLELGYILDAAYWGKGFGKEICNGLIEYCFNTLRISTVIARMYAANVRSVKLSENCGMKRVHEGETQEGRTFYEYEISTVLK